jgi:large subunit ribosomal protein L33
MSSKQKSLRTLITLECSECRSNLKKRTPGISRYLTSKNKKTQTVKLELLKHCPFCNKHTLHKEVKM